jgi:hypothetical protein
MALAGHFGLGVIGPKEFRDTSVDGFSLSQSSAKDISMISVETGLKVVCSEVVHLKKLLPNAFMCPKMTSKTL